MVDRERERWHNRIISEIGAKLQFLRNRAEVETRRGSQQGPDIKIITKINKKEINIEVQQFDSGAPWKTQTIPTWRDRHKLYTLIVFPEPVLERVLGQLDSTPGYAFFKRNDVFLFSDTQISDLVAFVGAVIVANNL
jgi:hypothetical protein